MATDLFPLRVTGILLCLESEKEKEKVQDTKYKKINAPTKGVQAHCSLQKCQ